MNKEILNKLKNIRLLIFDLEGVLLRESNISDEEIKHIVSIIESVSKEFKKRKLNFAILTARERDNLINKLEKIPDCTVVSSSLDKVTAADKLLKKFNLRCENVFFIGDEILDIPLLKKCGLSAAPKDARRDVKRVVDIVIKSGGCETIFDEIFTLFDKINLRNNDICQMNK